MSAEANIETVKSMYAAFGRGDSETILAAVTDDVDWGVVAEETGAPWYGIRHGKAEVAAFFADFGSAVAVEVFEPRSFAANGSEVFAKVYIAGKTIDGGQSIEMDLLHYFRFRDDQVEYYRGSEDTAQMVRALQD